MYKDFGNLTVHINRLYLTNFALGFDYYQLWERETQVKEASVFQLNFLFFNVTFTKWNRWL